MSVHKLLNTKTKRDKEIVFQVFFLHFQILTNISMIQYDINTIHYSNIEQ